MHACMCVCVCAVADLSSKGTATRSAYYMMMITSWVQVVYDIYNMFIQALYLGKLLRTNLGIIMSYREIYGTNFHAVM